MKTNNNNNNNSNDKSGKENNCTDISSVKLVKSHFRKPGNG